VKNEVRLNKVPNKEQKYLQKNNTGNKTERASNKEMVSH